MPLTAAHADAVPTPAVPTEQGILGGSGVNAAMFERLQVAAQDALGRYGASTTTSFMVA
jgi:hypothetical protein